MLGSVTERAKIKCKIHCQCSERGQFNLPAGRLQVWKGGQSAYDTQLCGQWQMREAPFLLVVMGGKGHEVEIETSSEPTGKVRVDDSE